MVLSTGEFCTDKHNTETLVITHICIFLRVLKNNIDLCTFKPSSIALEVQVTYKLYSGRMLLSKLLLLNKVSRNFSGAGL